MPPLSVPERVPAPTGRRHRASAGRRLLTSGVAAGVLIAVTFAGGGAEAQNVESLRNRAEQLANDLEGLERRSSELNEQYLETSEELRELEGQLQANQASVAEAQTQLDTSRGQAADYLVRAYMDAGSNQQIAPGASDPNEAVNSQVMLEVLRRGRQGAADVYRSQKLDLEARTAALDESAKQLSEAKERQADLVEEIESSVARQSELLNSANQELNSAVAAERARREAAEAERARAAAAEAQAAASRAAAAAAATSRAAASSPSATTAPTRPQTAAPAAPAPAAQPPAPKAPAAAPAPAPVSAPNGRAGAAIAAAMSRLGTPYRWGGTTPAGFDCSGLMLWSWAQAGVSLPRTSGAQRSATQRISFDQLQPGDLVFSGNPVYHVGMYIGGGQMIHSPQTGDVVKISGVRAGGSTSYGRIR